MATVFIPSQLKELTGGADRVDVDATTVSQAVEALEARYPGIMARLCDGDQLSAALQVSIDDAISSRGMMAIVQPDSEIHFIPAIGGG